MGGASCALEASPSPPRPLPSSLVGNREAAGREGAESTAGRLRKGIRSPKSLQRCSEVCQAGKGQRGRERRGGGGGGGPSWRPKGKSRKGRGGEADAPGDVLFFPFAEQRLASASPSSLIHRLPSPLPFPRCAFHADQPSAAGGRDPRPLLRSPVDFCSGLPASCWPARLWRQRPARLAASPGLRWCCFC